MTYVTAREAGFDYLRDRTVDAPSMLVQRAPDVAIVDEADCILIDEARVPLVIAGPAPSPPFDPAALARLVRQLRRGADYTVDEYGRTVVLTDTGFARAGALLGVPLDDPATAPPPERRARRSACGSAAEARPRLRRPGRPRRARRRVDRPRR